ncbi:ATP-binding protein [Cryobacterium sp. SO1]|uniref:sensor histidine kinase n=1 Tax=Cryobacterium sp. SO1 TaxID=1897061 RepID=UPI001022C4D0|nr:ATP-binding protein [Cryobacterium sp. SO1]RZI34379.1 Alkaline phosphatase synthesis sensor protein PhoR [Cryobacterium sp. SO1]
MNNLVAMLWAAPRHWRYTAILLILLAAYGLGLASLAAPNAQFGVAAWWPAAAAAVLAMLVARGWERAAVAVLVVLVSVASNLGGGRSLPVALGFGLANALEAVVVTGILANRDEPARLHTVSDVLRFTVAVFCGAVTIGLIAASTLTVFTSATFGTVLLSAIPSHAFAVFVLIPLALVQSGRGRADRRLELLIQVGFMLLVLGIAYGPGRSLPISFLILPLLTWAAFRFGIKIVAWELCGTALVASGLTSMGIGSFTTGQAGSGIGTAGSFVQIFLVTYAGSVLLLAAELAQRDGLLDREREVVNALRDLNRQKDDFVSSVSHELRTPITSILGFAEELEDTTLDPDQARFTRVIVRNSHRLAQLVEDLLDLSKMSTESDAGQSEPVDVAALVAECVEELAPQAQTAEVSLTVEFGAGPFNVHSSASDLRRVLTNLVSNAVKFTPPHGQVWVGCSAGADGMLLTVSDNGIGIPPADIEKVFGRFFRSASAESLAGTGLGLPLTKGLVDRLGGTIDLQSDGRTGTHVTVALPRDPALAGRSAAGRAGTATVLRRPRRGFVGRDAPNVG